MRSFIGIHRSRRNDAMSDRDLINGASKIGCSRLLKMRLPDTLQGYFEKATGTGRENLIFKIS